MKYQLVVKNTNEIFTPHFIGLAPNGELYSDGMNVTDRYIIRRSTGVEDKHGFEVYEDDIIKFSRSECKYKVIFERGMFGCYEDGEFLPLGETLKMFEVIGNIYENPNLYKG